MRNLRAEAFAKINLSLKVLGERPDGYHEIETVFQTIDLADTLDVADGEGDFRLETDDPAVPADERNLVHRAGAALARRFGVPASARVRLTKRIPAGAGLGGGSSDAAVALVLLARLWDLPLEPATAGEIALELGSDVPFFLHGGTAVGRGRGERLTELPDGPDRPVVLLVPPFPLSTARVYDALRALRRAGPHENGRKEPSRGRFFGENDLAPAAVQAEPRMQKYGDILRDLFPDSSVSGSGSCLAALGEARDGEGFEARLAALRRRAPEASILVRSTLSRPEYRRRSTVDFQKEVVHP